jgi:hypothetical protein
MRVLNRRFLLRKRVLVPLGTGVALLVVSWYVLLPWVVRGRVDAVLHQLNLRDVTFRVTRATPWSSTVRDIDAGDGNRIDELRVSYSAQGLWHRRVDNIRVTGLQLTADVREGGASIKPIEVIMRQAPPASGPAAEPVAEEEAPASARDWPFRSVRVEDSLLTVRTPDRAITLPFNATLRWPHLKADVAGLTIEGSIGDRKAADVSFHGRVVRGVDLTAVIRALTPEAPISIAGDVSIKGDMKRRSDQTTFDADVVAAAADEPAGPATKIAGTNVALEQGVFHIAGTFGDENRSLKVTAKDVTIAESSVGAKATGVSAEVLFDQSNSAPATQPTQVIRFDKLTASKLDLTDGIVRFNVTPDGSVHVQEARANLLGGVVSALDVPVEPGKPIPLTLVAANVELGELLKLLAQGKAAGEGKVNGRLPLIIADGGVQLGEGAVEASAGGRLSITDTDTLQSMAGNAAAGAKRGSASPQEQVRQNIVDALKDFEYESLVAQLKHDPEKGLTANVRMKGKGRTGAKQALDYDLRVTGLDVLLRSALGLHRTLTREATP